MVFAEDVVDVVALVEEDDVVAVVQIGKNVVADVRVKHVLAITVFRGDYLVIEHDDRGDVQALAREVVRADALLFSVCTEAVERAAACERIREQQHLERNHQIFGRCPVPLVEGTNVLNVEGGFWVVRSPLRVANLAMAGILR